MNLAHFIKLAFTVGLSTTYGWGEFNCGDIGKPVSCAKGAITASGEVFDPELPTAAVAAPSDVRVKAVNVWMRIGKGPCVSIRVNDKLNPRYIGKLAFDLSPRSLELLTGTRRPMWSGRVSQCNGVKNEKVTSNSPDPFSNERIRGPMSKPPRII